MAEVVVTVKLMPESLEIDLKTLEDKAKIAIENFGAEVGKVEIMPVGFGLNSLNIIFVMDEAIGSTDELEKELAGIIGVNSVEVTDVRRAIG